jgi:hypothetical protein
MSNLCEDDLLCEDEPSLRVLEAAYVAGSLKKRKKKEKEKEKEKRIFQVCLKQITATANCDASFFREMKRIEVNVEGNDYSKKEKKNKTNEVTLILKAFCVLHRLWVTLHLCRICYRMQTDHQTKWWMHL